MFVINMLEGATGVSKARAVWSEKHYARFASIESLAAHARTRDVFSKIRLFSNGCLITGHGQVVSPGDTG